MKLVDTKFSFILQSALLVKTEPGDLNLYVVKDD